MWKGGDIHGDQFYIYHAHLLLILFPLFVINRCGVASCRKFSC